MTEAGLDPHLLEKQLGQIRGIMSAKVVVGEDGAIREIHILAGSQRAPKQLVRDIESLSLLHFQKKIDYRKISIVQLEGRRITSMSRVRLMTVRRDLDTDSQQWKVTLEYEQKELPGEWKCETSVSEAEGAARATLKALEAIVGPSLGLDLREAKLAPIDGAMVVISAVSVETSSGHETLLGSSFVKESVGEAAARSVLGALNRRLPFTLE